MVDENTPGRQPVTIVEIDQDLCTREYGVSPCDAALGVTGGRKCYNTFITCQDVTNYSASSLTLRFCTPTSVFPTDEVIIPSVVSVSTVPTEINIGGGESNSSPLGRRASVTVVFRDHPYNDKFVDKYLSDRDFNPLDRSTFWAKWLARNPYYQNRALRVKEGYIGQSLSEMQTRYYLIDRIQGPDSNGRVTVVAKDVLKLAEDRRAQCPLPSSGKLASTISAVATSFNLTPTGIGNDEYPASGAAKIGSELVTYTRSGDAITLTGRAQRGTTAASHNADTSFQQVQVFSDVRVDSVIKTLLEDFGNVSSSYVPFADWQAEAGTYLAGYLLSTWVTEPTGVSELIGEILQQCICYIWWDERAQKIKFKAIRPTIPNVDIIRNITENDIVAESVKISRDTTQRLSQFWIYYNQLDPTESLTKAANFNRLEARVDLEAETVNQYGEARIAKAYSRWLDDTNAGEITTTGSRMLARYRDAPLYVEFSLDAKDRALSIADVITFSHRSLINDEGQPSTTALQVIRMEEVESGHKVTYKCQSFTFTLPGDDDGGIVVGSRYAYVMANGTVDYNSATADEKKFGGWISPNTGTFDDNGDAYRII